MVMGLSSPRTGQILTFSPGGSTGRKGGDFPPFCSMHSTKFKAGEWAKLFLPSLSFFQTTSSGVDVRFPRVTRMFGQGILL